MFIKISGTKGTAVVNTKYLLGLCHKEETLWVFLVSASPNTSFSINGVSKNKIEQVSSLIAAAQRPKRPAPER